MQLLLRRANALLALDELGKAVPKHKLIVLKSTLSAPKVVTTDYIQIKQPRSRTGPPSQNRRTSDLGDIRGERGQQRGRRQARLPLNAQLRAHHLRIPRQLRRARTLSKF